MRGGRKGTMRIDMGGAEPEGRSEFRIEERVDELGQAEVG